MAIVWVALKLEYRNVTFILRSYVSNNQLLILTILDIELHKESSFLFFRFIF